MQFGIESDQYFKLMVIIDVKLIVGKEVGAKVFVFLVEFRDFRMPGSSPAHGYAVGLSAHVIGVGS